MLRRNEQGVLGFHPLVAQATVSALFEECKTEQEIAMVYGGLMEMAETYKETRLEELAELEAFRVLAETESELLRIMSYGYDCLR